MFKSPKVQSIDEEYRFIQYHPFECGCQLRSSKRIGNHGLYPSPMLWVIIHQLPPFVIWIEDRIEASCPICKGIFTYRFDARGLAHFQMIRNRFGLYRFSKEIVNIHMRKVLEVRRRLSKMNLTGVILDIEPDAPLGSFL